MKKFLLMALLLGGCYIGLSILLVYFGISPPYSLSLLILIGATFCDHATTHQALKLGGKESNPFAKFLFDRLGVNLGSLMITGMMIIFIMHVFSRAPASQQFALALAYWIVPVNNLKVIERLQKEKRKVNAE